MPLSTDELLKQIESNQSAIMLRYRDSNIDQILRSNQLHHFKMTIEKYAPLYASDLVSDGNGA
jgi:hypothetical protein